MRRFSRYRIESFRGLGLLCGLGFLATACDGSPVGLTEPEAYQITEGACGEVVFVEKLGPDLPSAMGILEERKIAQFGDGQVTLDTYRLRVVDRNGMEPQKEFHAVRVQQGETQLLAHSVLEVVTSDGDLFHLHWCPD